jgi:hypothetical protein
MCGLLAVVALGVGGEYGLEDNLISFGKVLSLCQLEQVGIEVKGLVHVYLVEHNRKAFRIFVSKKSLAEKHLGCRWRDEKELVTLLD